MVDRPWLVVGWVTLTCFCACGRETGTTQTPDGSALVATHRTARVTFLEGKVRIKRSDSMEWLPAAIEMELETNDKVRTLRDSFATIEFERGGMLRVGPESLVSVTDLRVEPRNQVRRSTFTLMEGEVEAELDSLDKPGSEFRIRTPSAETSVIRREVAFQ